MDRCVCRSQNWVLETFEDSVTPSLVHGVPPGDECLVPLEERAQLAVEVVTHGAFYQIAAPGLATAQGRACRRGLEPVRREY